MKVFEWSVTYFVVTSQRFVLATGILTRKVNMMPLAKVTDMTFQRSAMGRILGYGEFILESAGQDQALTNVDYLPYPEQLYLEVCGLIFKDTGREPRLGPARVSSTTPAAASSRPARCSQRIRSPSTHRASSTVMPG